MGFWSSLVEGAKSAGGWVLDHSGDIANAVGTVAKIAGTFIVLDDTGEADHQSHLEDFHTNFKIASHKLQQRAKKDATVVALKAERRINANEFTTENVVLDSVTGIWKNPSPLSTAGEPSIPMYQDLSKWLATLGVPANASVDVASSVAEALFVGTNKASTANAVGDYQIQSIAFPYTDPEGQWTLDTAHAFYPLPLGASKDEKSWHSCIYAKFHPSVTYVAAKRQRKQLTAFTSRVKTGVPIWMINATINWGNAAVASAVYEIFIQSCRNALGNKGDRSVVSSNLTGVSQLIQIQGNKEDNPSTLQQMLISAAAKSLSDHTSSPGDGNNNGGHDEGDDNDGPADGTDTVNDGNLTAPVTKRSANGAGSNERVATFATGASGMPLVVPEVMVTKAQLIFVDPKGTK